MQKLEQILPSIYVYGLWIIFFLFGMSELRAIEKYDWKCKEIIHIALIYLKMLAIFGLGGW